MIDPEEITHARALATFRVAFIRRVGVGKAKVSYSDLQDGTGILVRTLKSWAEGQSLPHLDNVLKLCVFFGPEFTSEVLALAGQGGVEWVDEVAKPNAIGAACSLSQTVAEITERLADGVFDHRDCAEMGPKLVELATRMESQGKAMMRRVPR